MNVQELLADVTMSLSNEWIVTVFKCNSSVIKNLLVEFYRFVDDLKEVQSLHFLIRDRIDDEVVFSFRIMVDHKSKEIAKTKVTHKLSSLLSTDKFAVYPNSENSLAKYIAWVPEKRIADCGKVKFYQFIDALKNMSALVVEMVENDYFGSSERVELAHAVSWMLGCTEYGLLRTSGMEVGYYDRLEDKYCSYLRQSFQNPEDK